MEGIKESIQPNYSFNSISHFTKTTTNLNHKYYRQNNISWESSALILPKLTKTSIKQRQSLFWSINLDVNSRVYLSTPSDSPNYHQHIQWSPFLKNLKVDRRNFLLWISCRQISSQGIKIKYKNRESLMVDHILHKNIKIKDLCWQTSNTLRIKTHEKYNKLMMIRDKDNIDINSQRSGIQTAHYFKHCLFYHLLMLGKPFN